MTNPANHMPYILALSSTLLFSFSCIIYTHYSTRFSSLWMNTIKTGVAFIAFLIAVSLTGGFHQVSHYSLTALFLSGLLGLGIGDYFLLKAFTEIGPSRSLMLFGFSPLLTGTIGYLFFNQAVPNHNMLGIVFLVLCLLIFSLEGYQKSGQWAFKGTLCAALGICMDAIGVGLTRFGFSHSPEITPIEANIYRIIGALFIFIIMSRFMEFNLKSNFKSLKTKEKFLVIIGSITGTFLSLWLYLSAIEYGHLASLSALTAIGPFFASFFESIHHKTWPSKHWWCSVIFFLLGFFLLLK